MSNEAGKQDQPDYFNNQDHLDQLANMGVSVDRAQQFIKDNPGDYDRLWSALHDDDDGQKAAGGNNGDSRSSSSSSGNSNTGISDANWQSLLSKWQGMQPAAMQAFTGQFNAPGKRALSNASWTGGDFAAPQLKDISDWTKSYTPTTAEDMKLDPGYQWRLDQMNKQYQASAAAKGTLLTGGTINGLMNLGQDYASQEYGNVDARRFAQYQNDENMFNANRAADMQQNTDQYGRALQTFGTNYGLFGGERQNAQGLDQVDYANAMQEYLNQANIFQQNESNRYQSGEQNMMDMFNIDTGLFGRDLSTEQQGFAEEMGRGNLALQAELGRGNLALGQSSLALQGELGRGNLGLNQQQFDLSKILGIGGMNQNQQQINNQNTQFGQNFGEAQRTNSFNMFNTTDQNYMNTLMNMAQLGLQANGQQAGSGGNMADIMSQIGNANAAGRIGQGNAYGGALGQIGNNASYQSFIDQMRQSGYAPTSRGV